MPWLATWGAGPSSVRVAMGDAAIDGDDRAADIVRMIGSEKHDHRCHLVDRRRPLIRHVLEAFGVAGLVAQFALGADLPKIDGAVSQHGTGIDGKDADAVIDAASAH